MHPADAGSADASPVQAGSADAGRSDAADRDAGRSDAADRDAVPTYAVIDIDGTVADVSHRLHHLDGHRRSWSAFFAAAADDPPLADGVAAVGLLAERHEVVWLTGRPERYRQLTLDWLRSNGLPAGRLVMRVDADHRPARVAKLGLLRRIGGPNRVAVVLDDDADVLTAVRRAGYTVAEATWAPRDRRLRDAQEGSGRS